MNWQHVWNFQWKTMFEMTNSLVEKNFLAHLSLCIANASSMLPLAPWLALTPYPPYDFWVPNRVTFPFFKSGLLPSGESDRAYLFRQAVSMAELFIRHLKTAGAGGPRVQKWREDTWKWCIRLTGHQRISAHAVMKERGLCNVARHFFCATARQEAASKSI